MSGELKEVSSSKSFGGFQKVFSHYSKELSCQMNFAIYLPVESVTQKVPLLYFLSGLTCTEQNFITKSGFQKCAAEHGIIVVAPDTSPRGCNIEGEDESYDFGSGAGFYVDATTDKWKKHYRMYSYITSELPNLINESFPVISGKMSIFGHSMGGHGALVCSLRNPGLYVSVSAFAPICNPSQCPWGIKAFTGYLGDDKSTWQSYDACALTKTYNGPPLRILIDQGKSDNFLTAGQLLPENLVSAANDNSDVSVVYRAHEGYDHSYYFISTFIEDHFRHHMKFLKE